MRSGNDLTVLSDLNGSTPAYLSSVKLNCPVGLKGEFGLLGKSWNSKSDRALNGRLTAFTGRLTDGGRLCCWSGRCCLLLAA